MLHKSVPFWAAASKLFAVVLSAAALVACSQQATIPTGEDAEKIGDNLYKVENSSVKAAFVDPEVDFAVYKKIYIAPLNLDKVKIIQPSSSPTNRKPWELTDKDKELLTKRYQEVMTKYLQEETSASTGYEIVNAPGEGVLQLSSAILAIAPTAAKDDFKSRPVGRSRVFTEGAGSMTIGFAINDSATGKALITAVDQRSGWGTYRSNNRVTNMSDVSLMFGNWANKIRHGLDSLSANFETRQQQ
ncbi:DUF3313 family protein [Oceanicoccus sagamiensis]|uniref:DUF3313 domain-containing protein n=1 Tax=Oceanicoccus sagamiensis TaxID=716816 RepID=A0A1X9NEV4_9GAMM|nr:DUF3313 family protein [Oceanicoccus sagamiensis]ARN74415.1 hypothetical protein BST96_09950 [Oceanicoccus sagamiensis]